MQIQRTSAGERFIIAGIFGILVTLALRHFIFGF